MERLPCVCSVVVNLVESGQVGTLQLKVDFYYFCFTKFFLYFRLVQLSIILVKKKKKDLLDLAKEREN